MDRPLRADARRNRERVLAVAQEAFATEGLAVSIPEIARRAGVGVGTIYRQFPTKEALFEAIVVEGMTAILESARSLSTAEDAGAAFFQFVEEATEEGAVNGALKDALAGTGYDLKAATSGTAEELVQIIGTLLRRGQEAGAVRTDVTVPELFALISGVLAATATDRNRDRPAMRHLLSIVCDGLRARLAER
ncbi:TetR/AcrR family transcriptional regulator [Tenggerimyces flavus]|uniref:TetR/AcrR family transcriptional regulator n=1 Tax=Tenggerimyces flavus TaxID=1708749 RepID=A0ABV7Y591_9ACTN|nr:TetR/AcrR family transcriptional regulator [Tenggerimyces flavus]MBM7788466.1 AcrR family transcriptional regulator [Tenggerimyces flavus]